VIAPAENRRDLLELPRNVRRDLEFIWVEDMDQVLSAILAAETPAVVVAPESPSVGSGEAPAGGEPLAAQHDAPTPAAAEPGLQPSA
jgi:hypothetical protein